MLDFSCRLKPTEGGRLDHCLAARSGLSRRRVRQAIEDGGVYVDRRRCRKAGRILRGGEHLRLCILEEERLRPLHADQILWRHESLLLLHKRSGQYAQPALHRYKGTLPDELTRHYRLPPGTRFMPVHRLDRETSGLMLFSHDSSIVQHMQARWHKDVDKSYIGIVSPPPAVSEQRILKPISRRRNAHGCYVVNASGRACDSEFHLLAHDDKRALLHLIPHTGRSHQLRVHMAFIGSPLVGDTRYGGKKASRLMLHACALRFPLPHTHRFQSWNLAPEDDWTWPHDEWKTLVPIVRHE